MRYLSEDLIESAKRRSLVPVSQNAFSDADILEIASEEMEQNLVPLLMSVRENIYLTSRRVTITPGLSLYGTPERAIGNALKDIWLCDSNGRRMNRLSRADVDGLPELEASTGYPTRVMLVGDELQLIPTPAGGTLYMEQWYYARPNQLVASSECAKVSSLSSASGTTTFTVDTDLSASLSIGALVDIVSGTSPFLLWAQDAVITDITASTISVATTSVTDAAGSVEPAAGDYICPARKSNIPMCPEEFHPILAQMVGVVLLEGIGDLNKSQLAEARLEKMKSRAIKLISNRIEAQVERIANSNALMRALSY